MSRNARLAVFVLGALSLAGGTLLTMQAGGGIGFMLLGALLIASLALEGRYGRPGAPTDVPPHAWELTSERFVDDETGQLLEVWIDPLTGERRYEPAGSDPRLPGPTA
ncbi:MAG: hypothetical protein J0I69_08810 [Altererythrobacter sp.]|nr:hypothetical protein [Altererythrobacter sp.]OJU58935.1 MAG: hypothetical protein BGO08_04385 [Altererythrobacter sp. 66-12]